MKTVIININIAFAVILCLTVSSCSSGNKAPAAPAPEKFPSLTVPGMITDQTERMDYMLDHMWDAFTDPSRKKACDSTLISGVSKEDVESQVGLYATILQNASRKKGEESVANLFRRIEACEKADTASNVFEGLTELITKYLYDPNSPVRDEGFYRPFAEGLSKSEFVSEGMRMAYAFDASMCALNGIGTKAADFKIKDRNGKIHSLFGTKAPYTLLFFTNPGCQNCKEIIEQIKGNQNIDNLISSGKLAVINVYIDQDLDYWMEYSKEYPSSWTNGYDYNYAIRTDVLYNVRAIPSLYLLDADKNVILKDAPPEILFPRLLEIQ
ncbi:MAG: DUF5106 domain-containing protein [Bacteroidales bacterium]|nr:DUF5106 domain-containing protein [Bacteroidales bacterium]